ncbi:MAG TPA: phosphatidylglycerophosphatase A [Candidatus Acidoferrum sp.]|nr:phosphatidylglycerophosphatase A [Candidatus Acidoferrum sp.]
MSERTEPPTSASGEGGAASSSVPKRKPRLALFIATAGGLGYLPKAPGTWGSLGGLLLAMLPFWGAFALLLAIGSLKGGSSFFMAVSMHHLDPFLCLQIALAVIIGAIGVASASRAATFWGLTDPGRVVVDEVSGQHLTLVLGCALPVRPMSLNAVLANPQMGLITWHSVLNWKYLLAGFILFRIFDIWKPFPARQAESLPGGWGIMADDWVAGIYAGIGLWIARAAGL